jgi:multiple antibiotic resistance protein
MPIFLLAFPALFSIVNPVGIAFVFLSATGRFSHSLRASLARWIAIYSFVVVTASVYVGAYVLTFFGVCVPVLRVAGGIVIALSAWKMLNSDDATDSRSETSSAEERPRQSHGVLSADHAAHDRTRHHQRRRFARTNRPHTIGEGKILWFMVQMTLATVLLCASIYMLYRNADAISRWLGPTGTSVITRLSAFLLFCIGIQIFWNGAAELLGTLVR